MPRYQTSGSFFYRSGLDLHPTTLPFVEMVISTPLPSVTEIEFFAILKAEDDTHIEIIGEHHIPFSDVIVPACVPEDIDRAADIMP